MRDDKGIEYSLEEFISTPTEKKIVIFGAGNYGMYVFNELRKNGIDVYAFCDNDKTRLLSIKKDYPVTEFDFLKKTIDEFVFIIAVVAFEIKRIIKIQLLNSGVSEKDIIIPIPYRRNCFFDYWITFEPDFWLPIVKQQWHFRRKTGTHIVDYFEKNELFKIVLYEVDELKGWLDEDLDGSKVSILHKMKSLDDNSCLSDCDAVVLFDDVKADFIEEELMERTKSPIISMWDVLR